MPDVEDNFFSQVTDAPTRGGSLQDLLLTNTDDLIREGRAEH